jgi:CubicO group peptidase (beta-lactamase class C family)
MYAACISEVDGVRLLSDETVARASVPLSEGIDCVTGQANAFGLGFMLASEFSEAVGPRTFGHIGAGGSTAFADPDHGLAFCYAMNQMKMIDDPRSEALVSAMYAALT